MKIYIKRLSAGIDATGEYDIESKSVTIYKESILCSRFSENYRNKKLERLRTESVKNMKLEKDIYFKSPSTAACFVLGRSANGWVEWKDDNNKILREYR